jgi:hypothetical protein
VSERSSHNWRCRQRPTHPVSSVTHFSPCLLCLCCAAVQAWLDPVNLPTQAQLTCPVTGQVLKFLLQVYCPVDANPQDAFHRSIFLFVSPKVREGWGVWGGVHW